MTPIMKILKNITVRWWLLLGIGNLLLVAFWGTVMRLKVLLPLPFLNQKYLLHAHSHFAFSGWVSHTLMAFILAVFAGERAGVLPWKYQLVLVANLLASYGMLIGFSFQGYGSYSIAASSLTVFVSYVFAALCWRDLGLRLIDRTTRSWLRASLIFLVSSSIGTFCLAYLMASGNVDTRLQLAAVYFFLHFQYNGWFFFACMGLAHHWLQRKGIRLRYAHTVFRLFAWVCVPTYALSVLWWDIPGWLYGLVVTAAVIQGMAWLVWLRALSAKWSRCRHHLPAIAKWLHPGVAMATTIKFVLQGLSVIPSLSRLAYSFRPIVIGYLHLVLLVIISLFLIAYAYLNGHLRTNRSATRFTGILVIGIVLNELLLLLQGISGLAGMYINHIPLVLAAAATTIVVGLTGLLWSQLISTSRNLRSFPL